MKSAHKKKIVRLRPWLEKLLNKHTVPGVEWYDKEKLIFKVPWVELNSADWSDEKGKIFKLWAAHRGRYDGGMPDDYKTWKRNFRCAMNKDKDISNRTPSYNLKQCHVYQFENQKSHQLVLKEDSPSKTNFPSFESVSDSSGSCSGLTMIESSRPNNLITEIVNASNKSNQQVLVSHSNIPSQQACDPGNISTATHTYIRNSPIVAYDNLNPYIPTTSVPDVGQFCGTQPTTSVPNIELFSGTQLTIPVPNIKLFSGTKPTTSVPDIGLFSGTQPTTLVPDIGQFSGTQPIVSVPDVGLFFGTQHNTSVPDVWLLPETQPLEQSSVFGNRNPQTPMFPASTIVPGCNYQPQAPVSTQFPGNISDQNTNIFSAFSTTQSDELQPQLYDQHLTDNHKNTFAFAALSPGPNVSDSSGFIQEQLSPFQTVPGPNVSDSFGFWQEQLSPLQTVPVSSSPQQSCSGEQPMSTGSSYLSGIDPNVINECLEHLSPTFLAFVNNPEDFETDTITSQPFTPEHNDPAKVTNTSQVIQGGNDKNLWTDYTKVEQEQRGNAKSSPESCSRTTEKMRYQKFPESPTHECRHCEKKKSLYIELSYLDNLVKTDHLATGCCSIIYQTADNQTADNTELIMPAWPDDIGSKKAITKANTVLQNCHFGTILETDIKGNIYVTRNCKIKIFTDTKSTPEIAREIKTLVFDFEKDFEKVLELYKSNHIKTKPKPYLMVYFGLDPSKAHHGQMLISARVTSCAALNRLLEVDDIRSQKDEASLSIQMSMMDLKK